MSIYFNTGRYFMSSSFRTKVVYCISLIAIVACLGICTPALASADDCSDADNDGCPVAAFEPTTAALTGLAIGGLAMVRWIRKR